HLLLVGSGPLQRELELLAAKLNIAEQVTFCGAIPPDDVNLHYSLADLFVFASKSETQGMVILEAMSCGLPVVAVRASG
ncbi:glycosyltransferase, partial [Klebsiella pneumoniae]|uniref:glycosyltransferase n=1 Tax=Klebsiella pneumoniae TaxID=573 RepID=UPI0036405883